MSKDIAELETKTQEAKKQIEKKEKEEINKLLVKNKSL
jgi:hypothetical protein